MFKRYFRSYYKILLFSLFFFFLGWLLNAFLFDKFFIFNDILPYGRYDFSVGDLCFFLSISLVLSTLWGGLYEKI